MKRSLPLLLVFLALAVTAFVLWRKDRPSTLDPADAAFSIADTSKVDRFFIAERNGHTMDLKRTANGWTANGLPANKSTVDLVMKTFRRIEVRSPVPRSMQEHLLKNMAVSAKKVEIYTGGSKPEKIWYVGSITPDHNGTYMVLETPKGGRAKAPYVTGLYGFTGVLDTRFHTDLDIWRSPKATSVTDLDRVQSITVEHPATGNDGGFTLDASNGHLVLKDAQGTPVPMDTAAVRELLHTVQHGAWEEVVRRLPQVERDSILASVPWHRITILKSDGKEVIPFYLRDPRPGQVDVFGEPMREDPNRMYALYGDSLMVVTQRLVLGPMLTHINVLTTKE